MNAFATGLNVDTPLSHEALMLCITLLGKAASHFLLFLLDCLSCLQPCSCFGFQVFNPVVFRVVGVWFPGRSSGNFCTAGSHVTVGLQKSCGEVFLSLCFQVE